MARGLVYILTNPSLDGWVKIGMTGRDGITGRLQELNSPANIPLSYRCYATYEVDNPQMVEAKIHSIIDQIDCTLHARELLENGRVRVREFLKYRPKQHMGFSKNIAALRGDSENLKLYTPTVSQSQEQEFAENTAKRSNNSFRLLHIAVGEEISFFYDDSLTARVQNEKNKVEFEGEIYSVTGLAGKLLVEKCGWSEDIHVNGWRYFTQNGITLSDLRDRIERIDGED